MAVACWNAAAHGGRDHGLCLLRRAAAEPDQVAAVPLHQGDHAAASAAADHIFLRC